MDDNDDEDAWTTRYATILLTINDCQGRTVRSLNVKRSFTRNRGSLIRDLSIVVKLSRFTRILVQRNFRMKFREIDPFTNGTESFGRNPVRMSKA